jgi:hypothetical protein
LPGSGESTVLLGLRTQLPQGHPVSVCRISRSVSLSNWAGANSKTRRDKLTEPQRTALTELGIEWA